MRTLLSKLKLSSAYALSFLTTSTALASSIVLASSSVAFAEEVKMSDSQGISLTIYNQNFGLVRDVRSMSLTPGINHVRFEDVAAQIDPTTVSFQSLTAPNAVVVREQNYQYDLIDTNTILSKSVGKEIKFKQFLDNGSVAELNGTLLNSPTAVVYDPNGGSRQGYHGLVVKTADGIVLNPVGQIQLAEMPPGLVPKPSLLWKLEATKGGEHKTEVAYQTAGINWKCDYVAVVNKDDTESDLTSWVTLDNKSGATYKNAALKLLAGDVHRVQPAAIRSRGMLMAKAAAAPAAQFKEQSFAEYHLYSLQGKTDVKDKETKQMSLFNASAIPIKKLFIFDVGGQNYYSRNASSNKIQVKFELVNSEKNHLGMPMPKGKVRVYKQDQDGSLQFIGEDEIDHTPKDEKVRLYIGDAFDLVGERKQMSSRSIPGTPHIQRYTYEISLRNHKDSEVTITDVEHAYGDWIILNSSMPYTKKDSHTFEFAAKVPAHGETKISYEIEIK